jgi:hypothetical protein
MTLNPTTPHVQDRCNNTPANRRAPLLLHQRPAQVAAGAGPQGYQGHAAERSAGTGTQGTRGLGTGSWWRETPAAAAATVTEAQILSVTGRLCYNVPTLGGCDPSHCLPASAIQCMVTVCNSWRPTHPLFKLFALLLLLLYDTHMLLLPLLYLLMRHITYILA